MDDTIEGRLVRIEQKLDAIYAELMERKQVDEKLVRHITFIERTYDRLRTPLEYLRSACGGWFLRGATAPPEPLE